MPDRAVVNDEEETPRPCTCTVYGSNRPCPQHGMFNRLPSPADEERDWQKRKRAKSPQPRALVALSEDRQWLVVHHPRMKMWEVMERDEQFGHVGYLAAKDRWREDTGQDAHEVLADFLREREA